MEKKDAVGIFGGTFNPVHNAHLRLARVAKEKFNLSKIIFVPSARPPHKKVYDEVTPYQRYQMTRLAVKEFPFFSVSNVELKRGGKSYSVETVERLRKRFKKGSEIFFIIGSDSLSQLSTWKRIGKLFKLCKFVVFKRPGYPVKILNKEFKDRVEIVNIKPQDISSTEIRKRIKQGKSVSGMVPGSVLDYIRKNKLYH